MRLLKTILLLPLFMLVSCQKDSSKPDPDATIYKDKNGRVVKVSDLDEFTGRGMVDNDKVNPAALHLQKEASALGMRKKYDEAIHKLREAAVIQPDWAYPIYEMANYFLFKSEFDSAYYYYKKTDELEPGGYYSVRTALYTLEGEKSGTFPKGLYLKYFYYQQVKDSNYIHYIRKLTEDLPEYAPAWRELAFLLDDPDERLNVIEQGLSKNPDSETKGVLLVNKALILNSKGKKKEAIELLGNLILSSDLTYGNQIRAKTSLKYMLPNK